MRKRKNKTTKRIIAGLCCFIVFFSLVGESAVYAQTDKEKYYEILDNINKRQSELTKKKRTASEINSIIEETDEEMNEINSQIEKYEKKQEEFQAEIDIAQLELDAAIEERDKCQELLGDRIETMYMYGDVGYLELLFSSESFSDLISKVEVIKTLVSYDKEIIAQLEIAENTIIAKKEEIEEKKAEIDAIVEELEKREETLNALIAEKQKLLSEVNSEVSALTDVIDQEEEEAAALLKELVAAGEIDNVNAGKLAWPVPSCSKVTSPYGWRIHPVYHTRRFHTGTDIGASYGAKVVAPGSGKVTMARYYGGYGNTIIINLGKNEKGQKMTTLLAHNSKLLVKKGDTVMRGQQVAKAGATGTATGPHVHIEITVNGSRVNPINWLK